MSDFKKIIIPVIFIIIVIIILIIKRRIELEIEAREINFLNKRLRQLRNKDKEKKERDQ